MTFSNIRFRIRARRGQKSSQFSNHEVVPLLIFDQTRSTEEEHLLMKSITGSFKIQRLLLGECVEEEKERERGKDVYSPLALLSKHIEEASRTDIPPCIVHHDIALLGLDFAVKETDKVHAPQQRVPLETARSEEETWRLSCAHSGLIFTHTTARSSRHIQLGDSKFLMNFPFLSSARNQKS
jgi:hypothetical protein